MDFLLKELENYCVLSHCQIKSLKKVVKQKKISKAYFLLEAGTISKYLYFIVDGVALISQNDGYNETVRYITRPGDLVCNYPSFSRQLISKKNIIAATNLDVIYISYNELESLYRKDSRWLDLGRKLTEEFYLRSIEHHHLFQNSDASERYDYFLTKYEGIEQLIPLGRVASFLGMSQETLSRLRAKRKKGIRRP